MNIINRSILLALSVAFTTSAHSQVLTPELSLTDYYSPEDLAATLSVIGNVGDYTLENIDNVSLEDTDAGQTEVAGGGASSVANLAASFAEDLQINQGAVVDSSGLTQVVASNTITSSVNGNRVDISEVVEGENRIVDSFNNVQVPFNYSQNSGIASSVSQQITVQVGIEIPAAAAVTQ